MSGTNTPRPQDIPSTVTLIKSTILAAVVAGILLVTVVMPAEFGIDPTGLGKALGLKKMGEIKASLAEEAQADQAGRVKDLAAKTEAGSLQFETLMPLPQPESSAMTDELSVNLAPDEGTEIKVTMAKGRKVSYLWYTDGDEAIFDVHGDAAKLGVDYHSYGKGSAKKSDGVIVAAFDGNHGWYWRNRTSMPMTVTLQVNGEYTAIKHFR